MTQRHPIHGDLCPSHTFFTDFLHVFPYSRNKSGFDKTIGDYQVEVLICILHRAQLLFNQAKHQSHSLKNLLILHGGEVILKLVSNSIMELNCFSVVLFT